MKVLFLAPLPSAFGEAMHGARLASALVDRGHVVHFAAPDIVRPTVSDPRVHWISLEALPQLDTEVESLVAQYACDLLVLVDAAAVDKVARAFKLSVPRIASAAPRVVSIDCWNLVAPPPIWDYGVVSEPLDPWLLEHTQVIRPVPIAPLSTPGAFNALPALAPVEPRGSRTIVWPTARWQLPQSHDHPALAQIAAALEHRLLPVFAALDATIIHVSPSPLATRPPNYRHVGQLPAPEFEALLATADVLLSFNAAATSLATAVSLGVPTALCTAHDPTGASRPLWAWPLSLDGILAPTVHDNPFYATMTRLDPMDADELVDGLSTLLFDDRVRAERRAAQASYREMASRLPSGADLLAP